MTVKNVTVKNIFLRGIEYADGNDNANGAFDFENNTVTNVQGERQPIRSPFSTLVGMARLPTTRCLLPQRAIATDFSFGTDIFGNIITNSDCRNSQR